MQEDTSKRALPVLDLPGPIKEEIAQAKALFQEKYGIDPELHQAAIDPALPYPLNWWDLMEHSLYRQWQAMEADYYDRCTLLQMVWEREDYHNFRRAAGKSRAGR